MAETYKDVERERDKLRIELAEMTEYGRVTRSTLDKANKRIAELEQACESLREDACSKILAMTDEQVKALSAFDGHNPEDEAKIGKALVETILLKKRIAELERERRALQILVAEQAKDEGLWFVAQTAPEAYLQVELRLLHAAIDAAREKEK